MSVYYTAAKEATEGVEAGNLKMAGKETTPLGESKLH